jgi:hypothetical protein
MVKETAPKPVDAPVAELPQTVPGEHEVPSTGIHAIPPARFEPQRVSWLWEGRIPFAMLTLLIGDPGLGKSMFTCWLAAGVSRDGGEVLLATAEDSPKATVRPRLEAVGADLERVHIVEMRREADGLGEGIALPDDVPELARLVEQHGAKLVVIDPLMAHLPEAVNSWRDQSVRRALAPLARMAAEQGCAVLVVGHLNKAKVQDPIYRAGGSVGIPAAARSALLLARNPEDEDGERGLRRVLAHVKCNVAPLAESVACEVEPILLDGPEQIKTARIKETGTSTVSVSDLLGSMADDERTGLDEAADFLRDELADGPRPSRDVYKAAREAGISETTLKRAKSRAGAKAGKPSFSSGWEWFLPTAPERGQPEGGQPRISRMTHFVTPFDGKAKNGLIEGDQSPEGDHRADMAPSDNHGASGEGEQDGASPENQLPIEGSTAPRTGALGDLRYSRVEDWQ